MFGFFSIVKLKHETLWERKSQNATSTNRSRNFELFLSILTDDSQKTAFGIFKIFRIEILTNFIRCR